MNETAWKVTVHKEPSTKEAIFIEGLPGIGNVGKVVVDFLVEQTKAELVASFFSRSLPNSVFVNEDNLVELPKIELYHTRIDGKDYLFMTGDVQPSDEVSSYLFCEEIIRRAKQWHVKRIITLGGIGLQEEPEEPIVYCTGNDQEYIKTFTAKGASEEVYGTVGPIIGVSGLLLGLAQPEKIPAVALLSETLGHPMYLGLKSARSILQLLNKTLRFTFSLKELDKEIRQLDEDDDIPDSKGNPKLDTINKLKRFKDTNYIG